MAEFAGSNPCDCRSSPFTGCHIASNFQYCNRLRKRPKQGSGGNSLAEWTARPFLEAVKMIWIVTLIAVGVAVFWVKTRRQRKAKANTYVPQ
jgi:hypothetical protein